MLIASISARITSLRSRPTRRNLESSFALVLDETLHPGPEKRIRAGLDGKASERIKSVIDRLLAEGGHENRP